MKIRGFFLFGILFVWVSAFTQTVNLTFTGIDANNNHLQLNRTVVTNLTRGWQETLTWPDTVLTLENSIGIGNYVHFDGLHLTQNNPNPFYDNTTITLWVSEKGMVHFEITDVTGRLTKISDMVFLYPGIHLFRVSVSTSGTYAMSAFQNGKSSSVKLICKGAGHNNKIEYKGMIENQPAKSPLPPKSHSRSLSEKPFVFGDQMEYVGYAIINGTEMESHRITQVQGASQTFVLQFDEAQLQLPIVTTSPVTDITDTTAICGGNVSADGGSAITSRGLCWNTTGNPTMASHSIPMGDSLGAFSYCITGLLPNTTYYVRAYAVNSVGVKYGDVKSFTTSYDAQLPVVTTNPVTNVTDTTALCGGTVFGASISAKGVCWSTSPMPTIAAFHTDNGNGTGNFTSILSGLQEGTTYYIRSYATNHIGTSYGNELTFTTFSENNNGLPCIGTPTLTDYDGNVYATVQIGIQCWMKENLRTTHFANGTAIPTNDHTSASVPYRYCPNNNVANVPEYGYLYNWKAVMHQSSSSNANPSEVQGVCPIGWHVPSNVEWTQLANFLNTHDEYLCDSTSNAIAKALASTTGWTNYTGDDPDKTCYPGFNPSDNDASGFYAKPAGIFGSYASTFKSRVMFWTATDFSTTEACYRSIHNNNNFLISSEADKTYGFSVRCVRD